MYEHVEKPQNNQVTAVASKVVKKEGERRGNIELIDNRSTSVAQRENIKLNSEARKQNVCTEHLKCSPIVQRQVNENLRVGDHVLIRELGIIGRISIVCLPGDDTYFVTPLGLNPFGEGSGSYKLDELDYDNDFDYKGRVPISSDMILNALMAAEKLSGEIKKIMDDDKTEEYGDVVVSPQGQLAKCIEVCKDKKPDEIALYLYTTYFYMPLNKYLRTRETVGNKVLQHLINITLGVLKQAFDSPQEEKIMSHFRMELKPSLWIKDKKPGDTLSFPAFTSLHPHIDGVNNMWGNIERGDFGEFESRLALLVFEGKSKLLQPQYKYFKKEVEDILPPGTIAKIMKKEEIKWDTWIVDVYYLTILPGTQEVPSQTFNFSDEGDIIPEEK